MSSSTTLHEKKSLMLVLLNSQTWEMEMQGVVPWYVVSLPDLRGANADRSDSL